jgi:hypothetical protein
MLLPGPLFLRLVTLVAIDTQERVGLLHRPGAANARCSLPRCSLRVGETYSRAAARLAADCFEDQAVMWGTVVGRRWAPPPEGRPRTRVEEHVFLARICTPAALSPAADRTRSALTWVPRTALDSILHEHHADTTATLVDGYLDGWIPDGPITLY